NPVVGAIADEDPSLRVERDCMRVVELERAGAFGAPCLDELPVLREMHNPSIGFDVDMTIGNVEVAVWRDRQIRRFVEEIWRGSSNARSAERHENLSARRVLEDLIALHVLNHASVDNPHVVVLVENDPVREDELAATET